MEAQLRVGPHNHVSRRQAVSQADQFRDRKAVGRDLCFGRPPKMATAILSSRLSTPHISLGNCPRCTTPLEYLPPGGSSSAPQTYQVRCFSCGTVTSHTPGVHKAADGSRSEQSAPSSSTRKYGRKIGSDERPLVSG